MPFTSEKYQHHGSILRASSFLCFELCSCFCQNGSTPQGSIDTSAETLAASAVAMAPANRPPHNPPILLHSSPSSQTQGPKPRRNGHVYAAGKAAGVYEHSVQTATTAVEPQTRERRTERLWHLADDLDPPVEVGLAQSTQG